MEWLAGVLTGDQPVFILLAGPHGAGKTTFREQIIDPIGLPFINPDALSMCRLGNHAQNLDEARISTLDAEAQIRAAFANAQSVGLETVFSDQKRYKLKLLNDAKQNGFRTLLIFIGLDSAELSQARVGMRVEDGGHDVADETIIERYDRCFGNLKEAIAIVDLTLLYDNSDYDQRHRLVAEVAPTGGVNYFPPLPNWFTAFGIQQAISTIAPTQALQSPQCLLLPRLH